MELVVDPWADVYIDGELVATTPTSERIALPPGRHYVKYKNPFFQEQAAEIFVKPGITQRLSARLSPKPTTEARQGDGEAMRSLLACALLLAFSATRARRRDDRARGAAGRDAGVDRRAATTAIRGARACS